MRHDGREGSRDKTCDICTTNISGYIWQGHVPDNHESDYATQHRSGPGYIRFSGHVTDNLESLSRPFSTCDLITSLPLDHPHSSRSSYTFLMSTYKCAGASCGETFPSQRSLSGHMARCSKYKDGVKNHLRKYKNTLALEKERSAQLSTVQANTSGLSGIGGMAPIAEATGSGADTMEQVDLVRVHNLHVGYATDVTSL
jgi:hypothetical protein